MKHIINDKMNEIHFESIEEIDSFIDECSNCSYFIKKIKSISNHSSLEKLKENIVKNNTFRFSLKDTVIYLNEDLFIDTCKDDLEFVLNYYSSKFNQEDFVIFMSIDNDSVRFEETKINGLIKTNFNCSEHVAIHKIKIDKILCLQRECRSQMNEIFKKYKCDLFGILLEYGALLAIANRCSFEKNNMSLHFDDINFTLDIPIAMNKEVLLFSSIFDWLYMENEIQIIGLKKRIISNFMQLSFSRKKYELDNYEPELVVKNFNKSLNMLIADKSEEHFNLLEKRKESLEKITISISDSINSLATNIFSFASAILILVLAIAENPITLFDINDPNSGTLLVYIFVSISFLLILVVFGYNSSTIKKSKEAYFSGELTEVDDNDTLDKYLEWQFKVMTIVSIILVIVLFISTILTLIVIINSL